MHRIPDDADMRHPEGVRTLVLLVLLPLLGIAIVLYSILLPQLKSASLQESFKPWATRHAEILATLSASPNGSVSRYIELCESAEKRQLMELTDLDLSMLRQYVDGPARGASTRREAVLISVLRGFLENPDATRRFLDMYLRWYDESYRPSLPIMQNEFWPYVIRDTYELRP